MFSVQLIPPGRKMRSLNQESMSCALNSVSVLKCKGSCEERSHSVVRQVRHSNNCSLLFLVIDLVYFPSLLPSDALEQACKQGMVSSGIWGYQQCTSKKTLQEELWPNHTGTGAREAWAGSSHPFPTGPMSSFSRDFSLSVGDIQPWMYPQHSS